MAKKPTPSFGSDMARRIWLAGIGAYGNAFSEAQESLSKVSDETAKRFDELVQKGEAIEQTVDSKRQEVVRKVTSAPAFSLDDRIRNMRERLGLSQDLPEAGNTAGLEARLDRIEQKLDTLLSKLEDSQPARKTVKRKTASKASPRKTAKKKT